MDGSRSPNPVPNGLTLEVPMADLAVRSALAADLGLVADIFYDNQFAHDWACTSRRGIPSLYQHELETGELYVAARGDEVVGFAGLIQRGRLAFLSDLFVRPAYQSSGIGTRLLRRLLPRAGYMCCTLSSADPRALALYARSGMLPRWPHFQLLGRLGDLSPLPSGGVEVGDAVAGDSEVVGWDAEIGGRYRPEDHAYWLQRRAGAALWFTRRGERIGYGYVQAHSDDLPGEAQVATLGPIGVRALADALPCVGAAVGWARARYTIVRVGVPAPHPALAPLLRAGFRIAEVETFCSTTEDAVADVRRYLPSGGDLF
jgi:GNAT superfamily N-acetyltransferase